MKLSNLIYKYNETDELISVEEYENNQLLYSYSIYKNFFIKKLINENLTQIKLLKSKPKMMVISFDDYYVVRLKDETELSENVLFHIEKINGFFFPCLLHDAFIKKFEYLLKK